MGWGAPGVGDDLGWGGEATRGVQGCGGGPPSLGLPGRDIRAVKFDGIFAQISVRTQSLLVFFCSRFSPDSITVKSFLIFVQVGT